MTGAMLKTKKRFLMTRPNNCVLGVVFLASLLLLWLLLAEEPIGVCWMARASCHALCQAPGDPVREAACLMGCRMVR